MTPDEFDQKRRELIAQRTFFDGYEVITNRINILLGLLKARQRPANERHAAEIDRKLLIAMTELGELIVASPQRPTIQ